MEKNITKVSKYLSFILRHKPEEIGLELDAQGWASITQLIENTKDFTLDRELLDIVVETNDKQRFAFSSDGLKIRANQGHSIEVDLKLPAVEPPETLYHGTAERFHPSINADGLIKGNRHHVHLTESLAVAKSVGSRYGKPVLLKIDTKQMFLDGQQFYKTANNVWLVDAVAPQYILVAYEI